MAVCKFFLQGNCRFGGEQNYSIYLLTILISARVDNCKFEHPRDSYRNDIREPRPQLRGNAFDVFRNPSDREKPGNSRGNYQGERLS